MSLEKAKKVTPKSKSVLEEKVVKKIVPAPVSTKIVQNVSLQSWSIPTGAGKNSVWLVPGASVPVPVSAITARLVNLQKRRLIRIS
jgi:hypothetical protein